MNYSILATRPVPAAVWPQRQNRIDASAMPAHPHNPTPGSATGITTASGPPPEVAAASPAMGDQPRPKKLGLKKNFGWAFSGNAVYQACQWLNFVVLAKLTSADDVGRFALALAICTPITVFSSLNLRAVQVTDARDQHRFGHFLAVQLVSSLLAFLAIASIAGVSGFDLNTVLLIMVVGLGQAILVIRDVFIAFSQKHERMDTVALSKASMGILSVIALGVLVWSTGSLLMGVIGLQASKLAIFLLLDIRTTSRLVRIYANQPARTYLRPIFQPRVMAALAWLALPLGISAVMFSFFNNVPLYYISAYLGEEQLGYFAAILALAMAGKSVVAAVALSSLPRLSRYFVSNRRAYIRLLIKLVLVGAGIGVIGVIVAALAGPPLLTIMFTPEYAQHSTLFMWAMIYGMIGYVVTLLGKGMIAMRRFRIQPLANLVSLVVVGLLGWVLIPQYGLIGAVLALIAGHSAYGVIALAVISIGLRQHRGFAPQDSASSSISSHAQAAS